MSEWISLLDACNIRTGKLDSNMEEPEGNYPFFTCAPKPHRINSFSFEGDVIILAGNNAAGNFHCQRYSGKFDAYQRTYVITAGSNFDIDYIFYYLKLNLIYFSKKSQGSQTKFLTMTILNDFVIKVLPIDEQQKISKLLKFLDQKIALNNHINEELEAMAKTLYDYWFVQFDFPDENGKPYKSSGGKMVYNDQLKREIPEGWGVDSLWNIATFYNGLAMQKFRPASETDESLPVIKIREMFSGFSKDTEKASTAIPKEAIIEAGDILFSWSATLEVILWGGEKGALNQHIFKVTSEKYPKSFIYNELRSYLKVFKTIAELRKTTMGHITQDHLKQAMIIVPPNDLIDEIHNRISPILKQQLDLKQQNQELTQLRDWLLPMLMNGQARVK